MQMTRRSHISGQAPRFRPDSGADAGSQFHNYAGDLRGMTAIAVEEGRMELAVEDDRVADAALRT